MQALHGWKRNVEEWASGATLRVQAVPDKPSLAASSGYKEFRASTFCQRRRPLFEASVKYQRKQWKKRA